MSDLKIFPAIGIARVGDALSEYYICPEVEGALPSNPDGSEFTEHDFRDNEGRLKRQAARFKIFNGVPNSACVESSALWPGSERIFATELFTTAHNPYPKDVSGRTLISLRTMIPSVSSLEISVSIATGRLDSPVNTASRFFPPRPPWRRDRRA